jgi:hypothetical protein
MGCIFWFIWVFEPWINQPIKNEIGKKKKNYSEG